MVKTAREAIEYALDVELVKLYLLVISGVWTFLIADGLFFVLGRLLSDVLTVALQIPALLLTFAGIVGIVRYCLTDLDATAQDPGSDATR